MKLYSVLAAAFAVQSAVALGFKAQFVNVPEEALELENVRAGKTLPIERNYQSRIDAQIVGLGSKQGEVHKYLVKKLYEFDVEGLTTGEYELLVHSHDFHIRRSRYRVTVNESEISVVDDFLGDEALNRTLAVSVSEKSPLLIEALTVKIFQESPRNKLKEMLMQSPFGFIFKNRAYTLIFLVCMGLMITPLLIQWFFPDLADKFDEMQKEANEKRSQRVQAEKQQAAPQNEKPKKTKKRS